MSFLNQKASTGIKTFLCLPKKALDKIKKLIRSTRLRSSVETTHQLGNYTNVDIPIDAYIMRKK